jgi:hypothetical protein
MESGAVIKGFDVVEDRRARLGITGEALMIDQLVFEAAPEGLDEGIVVAIALAAHGGDENKTPVRCPGIAGQSGTYFCVLVSCDTVSRSKTERSRSREQLAV